MVVYDKERGEDRAELAEELESSRLDADAEWKWTTSASAVRRDRLESIALSRIRNGCAAASLNGLLLLIPPLLSLLPGNDDAGAGGFAPVALLPGLLLLVLGIGVLSRMLVCAGVLLLLTMVDAALTLLAGEAGATQPLLLVWLAAQAVFAVFYLQALRGILLYRRLHPPRQKKVDATLAAALQRQLPLVFGVVVVAAGAYVWGGYMGAAARGGGGSSVTRAARSVSPYRGGGGGGRGSSSGSSGSAGSRPAGASSARGSGSGGGGGGGAAALAGRVSKEGERFGAGSDSEGCVSESLRRHGDCSSPDCYSANAVFLAACLGKSSPTPGFCEGIPRRGNGLASAVWRAEACAGVARGNEHCEAMLDGVQYHCEALRKAGG